MKTCCRNVQNQMLPFLSGELSPAESAKIGRHLDECPACAQLAAQFEAAQERLQNVLGKEVSAPPTLDARVMATIRSLPPRRASWPAFAPPWSRFRRVRLALGFAGAVCVAYYFGANPILSPSSSLVRTSSTRSSLLPAGELISVYQTMRGHVMVAGNTASSVGAQLQKMAPPHANADLKLISLRDPQVKLLGGCWMYVGGRNVASFCFSWKGRRVSVFQCAANATGSGFHIEKRDGISVSQWQDSGKTFALVVEAPPEEAMRLSRQIVFS